MPAITNYIIALALLSGILFSIRNKEKENPGIKISGLSIKTILVLIYIAIAIDVLLMVAVTAGWMPQ